MTFDDFIKKWNTKGIDFDGVYGDQCMDLMHQYCVEVLGIPDGRVLAAPSAKDVWLTTPFGKDKFEAIANTPTGVPNKGDIILWGTGIGPYGHVAVFVEGNSSNFRSFDQNFPTDSKCHVQNHPSYVGVLGWLRFKGAPTSTTPDNYKGYDLSNKESMKVAVDILVRVQNGEFTTKAEFDKVKSDYEKAKTTSDNLNQQINDRNNDIVALNGKISNYETEVTNCNTRADSLFQQAKKAVELEKQVAALSDKVIGYQNAEKSWNRSKAQYEKQISDLKANALSAAIKQILEKFGIKTN